MTTNLEKIKNFDISEMSEFVYNMLNDGGGRCIKCPLDGICETKYYECSTCKGRIMRWLSDKAVSTNLDVIKEFEVSGVKPFDICENINDMVEMLRSNMRCETCWLKDNECDVCTSGVSGCGYVLKSWLLREANIKNEK